MKHTSFLMKKRGAGAALLIAALMGFNAAHPSPLSPCDPGARNGSRVSLSKAQQRYSDLPLSFEENRGQAASAVKFTSHCDQYTLLLTATEAALSVANIAKDDSVESRRINPRSLPGVLGMRFAGGDAAARVTGVDPLPGKSNYLIGNDPKRWQTNVPTYSRVRCEQVYGGIDVVYYGSHRELEYDLV